VSAEITSVSVIDVSGGMTETASTPTDRRALKGAVYRIAPDGLWDELWTSRDDSPYDITLDQNGSLIVATGNKGKMYRPQKAIRAADAAAARQRAQVDGVLARDAKGRLLLRDFANPGKLFRLSSERSTRGTDDSEPRDAQMVASWGTLSWHGAPPHPAVRPRSLRVRETPRRLTTRGALVRGVRRLGRIADHQPEGAVPAVARRPHRQRRRAGAHLGVGRLSPAQSAAAGSIHHDSSARHRLPEAVHQR
jgi:hypothetical protein